MALADSYDLARGRRVLDLLKRENRIPDDLFLATVDIHAVRIDPWPIPGAAGARSTNVADGGFGTGMRGRRGVCSARGMSNRGEPVEADGKGTRCMTPMRGS